MTGLTTREAADLLRQYGPNQLPDTGSVSRWQRLLAEFVHFFAVLLWAAAGLAFVACAVRVMVPAVFGVPVQLPLATVSQIVGAAAPIAGDATGVASIQQSVRAP